MSYGVLDMMFHRDLTITSIYDIFLSSACSIMFNEYIIGSCPISWLQCLL